MSVYSVMYGGGAKKRMKIRLANLRNAKSRLGGLVKKKTSATSRIEKKKKRGCCLFLLFFFSKVKKKERVG